MTRDEKFLYIQVHPLRLGAAVSGVVWALPLLWTQHTLSGLAVAAGPQAAAALALSASPGALVWVRGSSLGRYARRHLGGRTQAARAAAGATLIWAAAAQRPVVLGLAAITLGGIWLHGLPLRRGRRWVRLAAPA
jgi:hypothetical protein